MRPIKAYSEGKRGLSLWGKGSTDRNDNGGGRETCLGEGAPTKPMHD